MVKFDLISDIHLDFTRAMEEFNMVSLFPEVHGDYLLVAGDICTDLCKPENDIPNQFFEAALEKYKKVFCILGNHDYWARVSVHGTLRNMVELASARFGNDRIQFLENQVVDVDGVKLIGATLWSDIPTGKDYYVQTRMNDYRYTFRDGESRMTVEDTIRENKKSFEFIQKYVEDNPNEKIIILTHHCPSFQSGNKKDYYDRTLTYAYCNNYDKWIDANPNVKYWCHGHVHDEIDYKIGSTRVLANPCGYIYDKSSYRYFERMYDKGTLQEWTPKALEVA